MHTTTNYYLFSLAVSDLVLLVSGLTPEMYFIWEMFPYPFGEATCVYSGLAAETSTNATILTITAFTVERYIAICRPFLSHTVSKFSRVVKFIIGIWITSFFLAIPQAIQMGLVYELDKDGAPLSDEYILCSIKDTLFPFSFLISTIIFFVIPLAVITVLYILIGIRLKESARASRQECQARFSERFPYPFGEATCVYSGLAAETSTNATILTITAFTVERYIAICRPFLSHTVSKFSRVVKFIIRIWITSFFLAIPQAIQMGLVYELDKDGAPLSDEYILCSIKDTLFPFSFLISTIIFFVIPLAVITVLYILIGIRLKESARASRQECQARFSERFPYPFGEATCVYSGLAAETSTNATILTITAFTVERYIAICRPFLSHTVSKFSRVVKFIIRIWITSFFLAIPQAIQMGLVYELDKDGAPLSDEYILCSIKDTLFPFSFLISTIIFFVIPLAVITVLYILIGIRLKESARASRQECQARFSERLVGGSGKGKGHCVMRRSQRTAQHSKSTRRVVKMLVAVVVAFFICWAPFQVQRLYAIYAYEGANTSRTAVIIYKTVTYISGVLFFLSTAVNPVLYNVMSLKFRQAFKSTLTKCCGRRRRRGDVLGCGGEELQQAEYFRTNYSLRKHRSSNRHHSNDGKVNVTEI